MLVFSILNHVALPFLHGLNLTIVAFAHVTIPEVADGPYWNLLGCKFLYHILAVLKAAPT
jgi:hypothetical protein